MANEEQVSILRQGVDKWNQWREENPSRVIDLWEADLSELKLNGAHLINARLNKARLSESKLIEANLLGANLNGASLYRADLGAAFLNDANLSNADLRGANLKVTTLSRADLTGANLYGADFRDNNVREANFSGAVLGQTTFINVDLSRTRGLEDVKHENRSFVDIAALYRSLGKIPERFLRGCGLSDLQIETAKLAKPGLDPKQVTDIIYKIHQLYLGGGIQYYSCFISYNSKDEAFARQLHDDLQNNSVRCWFAPEDMKIGDQIRPRINQEIRLRDKLLVILSENSVKSEWVGDEVESALEEESKSNRLVLFPIRLDESAMNIRDDWAAKIKRRRHIGDFSNWKDGASYQKAFEHLLRDLKATGGEANGE